MSFMWDDMDYWKSGEWQVIQERLDDMTKAGKFFNPAKENLFAALDATPFDQVKVAIIGQDPYPNSIHATGIAFSVPKSVTKLPPTLENIFKEYSNDLGLPTPSNGCLDPWCARGALLWNACPTCESGKPGSHSKWEEWEYLTKEIVERLNKDCKLLVFLGAKAKAFTKYVNYDWSDVILTSHPSPLGVQNPKTTNCFFGSRLFSSINANLVQKGGVEAINWRL